MITPITLLYGRMSRELMRLNAPFRQPKWSALPLIETPHLAEQVHTEFLQAGADVITTNSYAIVPFHIGDERFDKDAQLLAECAGQLAKNALRHMGRGKVAGSIPPLFLVRIALICLTKIKYKDLPHRLSIN